MSASIDPYGLMTKSGKMKELAAVGFYDFELKAKISNRLSTEEKKGSPVGRFLLQPGLLFGWTVHFELAAMRSCFLCALASAAASSFCALAFARASAFSSLAFSFALVARI